MRLCPNASITASVIVFHLLHKLKGNHYDFGEYKRTRLNFVGKITMSLQEKKKPTADIPIQSNVSVTGT